MNFPRARAALVRSAALCAAAGLLSAGAAFVWAAGERRVVILRSGEIPIYDYAVDGFMKALSAKVAVVSQELVLPKDDGVYPSFMAKIAADKPDLVFTVGTASTRVAREHLQGVPFVFSMIVDPMSYGLHGAGAVMEVQPDLQLAFIRKSFPTLKRIGLVYSPERNKNVVRIFRDISRADPSLIMIEANSSEQLSVAIGRLSKEADCLLMIADAVLYSPQTATQVILQTLQLNLPIIAISPSFVKAGALAAIYPDYTDNGARAAEAGLRLMAGERAQDVPLLWPHVTRTAVNLIVAQRLGIRIRPDVVESADQVVK